MSGDGGSVAAPWGLLEDDGHALFLDFDGTLVELAERPELVTVAASLPVTLGRLQLLLHGKLALVSGRPIAQIDALLAPLVLPVAGVHGLERRGLDGQLLRAGIPDLAVALAAANTLAAHYPQLWVELKYGALALHYRQAPELGPLCLATMLAAVQACPGSVLLPGKMVVEIKPAAVDKGTAIAAFLAEAPFAGQRAVFVGDDLTDEAGFAMAQLGGGAGIKVGPGPTIARYRIDHPAALALALAQLASTLSRRTD